MKKELCIISFAFYALFLTGCTKQEDVSSNDETSHAEETIERDDKLILDLRKQITDDGKAIGITETRPNYFEKAGEYGVIDFKCDLNNGSFILSNGFSYYYEDDTLDYRDGFILFYNHSINPDVFKLSEESEHGEKEDDKFSFENAAVYKNTAIQHMIPQEYYRAEDYQNDGNLLTEEAAEYWRKIISNSLKQYRYIEDLVLDLKAQIIRQGGIETSQNFFEQKGESQKIEYRCDLNKGQFILWNDWVYSYEEDSLDYKDGCLLQYNHSMKEDNFVLSGECRNHNQDSWEYSKEWAMKQKEFAIEYLKGDTYRSRHDYDQETGYSTEEAAEYWRRIICNSLKQY